MGLREDIETLRGMLGDMLSDGEEPNEFHETDALARIIALLEPLAGLTPEQANELAACIEALATREPRGEWVAAYRSAAALFSRLGEGT